TDLVMGDPGLTRDGLDHVVAVEILKALEEVKRAARAAGAAHIDVDDREAERVGDHRDAALRTGWIRVSVAGVLDQRRPRRSTGRGVGERETGRQRDPRWQAGQARRARRRMDVDCELRAVASGQVAITV